MSAISFGRPFVPSLPPSHTGDAHRPAGLNARHGPQGPDTGAERPPSLRPNPSDRVNLPDSTPRKPSDSWPLPSHPQAPGGMGSGYPTVQTLPYVLPPGVDLESLGKANPSPVSKPWFVPPDWNKPDQPPGWPDCLPGPCGDDTSRTAVTPTAKPTWHVLDTGPCGPDEVKIVIHENGGATVTVNGTDYDYSPHTAQDLRVIVDKNDNVQIQDQRSYDDRMREPQPVKIEPRS